jgi:hypothetical protein
MRSEGGKKKKDGGKKFPKMHASSIHIQLYRPHYLIRMSTIYTRLVEI